MGQGLEGEPGEAEEAAGLGGQGLDGQGVGADGPRAGCQDDGGHDDEGDAAAPGPPGAVQGRLNEGPQDAQDDGGDEWV